MSERGILTLTITPPSPSPHSPPEPSSSETTHDDGDGDGHGDGDDDGDEYGDVSAALTLESKTPTVTFAPLSPRGDDGYFNGNLSPPPIATASDDASANLSFNFDVTTPRVSSRESTEAKATSPVAFAFDFNSTTPRVSRDVIIAQK